MEFSVDGRKVFAATGGKAFAAGLPAIIFVHGAAADHTVWKLQTRYFAWHGRGVLAVDMPAHGRSDGPPIPTIEGLADWLVALLDAAGLQQVPPATPAGYPLWRCWAVPCPCGLTANCFHRPGPTSIGQTG
jgi:pimeloyl-ACP methyl ester carboxylesterase